MNIAVFGLGYVGTISAACLARDGHTVVGVDVNAEKVRLVALGETPVLEPDLDRLVAEGVSSGRLRATTDAFEAVQGSDLALITVGTPAGEDGGPDLTYVLAVSREIGLAAGREGRAQVVALRSTAPPGTLARCAEIILEAAAGVPVHLASNPEFLREGSAVWDYDRPPYTLIGTDDPRAESALREAYAGVNAPLLVVAPAVAEMVKYAANAWHAAKIAFSNEIAQIAKAFDVDGRQVMELLRSDTKLNVSPAYMRPGFAYGGSCLPKDVSALLHSARIRSLDVPLLRALPASNDAIVERASVAVVQSRVRTVALLGLAFKPGTDDLRESPAVVLAKRLIGEGHNVRIYDPLVYRAHLMGTNLAYIQENLPHFQSLLVGDPREALAGAELVVVSHATPEFREILEQSPEGTRVLDLVGVFDSPPPHLAYEGLMW
ncbi:MAG: UDP-glucose/GDP-mannose dehydrogenase family protein [Actinobacteria bacterium]|nr:UDP-glucose/GDP-mannose dehydrogenase family protein [Actinomycetota bacterium]